MLRRAAALSGVLALDHRDRRLGRRRRLGAGAVIRIDAQCTNDSWHSSAHKMETRFTVAATFAAPLVLAFAFRRLPAWRGAWLPTLLAVPAAIVVGVVFSFLGDSAATRATTTTWFVWLAFIALSLRERLRWS